MHALMWNNGPKTALSPSFLLFFLRISSTGIEKVEGWGERRGKGVRVDY